jgi:hypothetical protein
MIPVMGDDTLSTTLDPKRFFVDVILVGFELYARMDRFTLTGVRILVKYSDDVTNVGRNHTADSTDRKVGNLMVVDTAYIDATTSSVDETYVLTTDTTVSATINE